ncbi:hypothetical protein [Salipiger mucosus]|uniref:Uncharacterized protein n=1 Tax=Salipiger mucosus DSM 16094 TaxID=1123237 RepID=S9QRK9_9RHOB|nr:hypothetical protein [Salipiger mucosus]EPX82277.1 hypothetical protein Salmuc_03065 [Salipiger mucosus DSM 16094]
MTIRKAAFLVALTVPAVPAFAQDYPEMTLRYAMPVSQGVVAELSG